MSKRRHRWSLLSVFVVVAVCAVVLAILAYIPRPKDRFFVDTDIVAFIKNAESVEVFRLAPHDGLLDQGDDETHATYPVAAGPIVLNDEQRDRLQAMLLDPSTWQQDTQLGISIVPNFYLHRIRYRSGTNTLDVDLGIAHVAVFYNGQTIRSDHWHEFTDTDKAMTAMIEEFLK